MNRQEILIVKELGDKIGYGHLMNLASSLWRQSLIENGYPEIGAFIPTVTVCIKDEDLEMHLKESKHYDSLIKKELEKIVIPSLMKVTDSKISRSDTYITFVSDKNFTQDSYINIIVDNKIHHFQVTSIELNDKLLTVEAKEVGYWVNKFYRKDSFDLRTLIGVDVTEVIDEKEIKQIITESCWC